MITFDTPLGMSLPRTNHTRFTQLSAITGAHRDEFGSVVLEVARRYGDGSLDDCEVLVLAAPEVAGLAERLRNHRGDAARPGPMRGSWGEQFPDSRAVSRTGLLVMGETDISMAGNSILRIGRLLPGRSWEVSHHVALGPSERDQLIAFLEK